MVSDAILGLILGRNREKGPSPYQIGSHPNPKQKSAPPLRPRLFLSIPTRIGKPRCGDEELLPSGAKGTTTAPFDGGAFTFEVLAHAGKGGGGGAAASRRRTCTGSRGGQPALGLSPSQKGGKEERKGKGRGRARARWFSSPSPERGRPALPVPPLRQRRASGAGRGGNDRGFPRVLARSPVLF